MQVIKLNDIIEQKEAIVYFDPESGLLISANIENYFIYYVIDETDEYELAGNFPVAEYVEEEVKDRGQTIIDILINGAKKLSNDINENKVTL